MTTGQNSNDKPNVSGSSVHVVRVATLVTICISLLIGVIGAIIIRNVLASETISLSTPVLISLLFGVALSLASIVLAITAISLGRNSERVMTIRSDESIRLQNEIFTKTTEALTRIESSTGVTEKRIEDMISGRAGVISDRITDRLLREPGLETRKRNEIEREIRESLMSELANPTPAPSEEELKAQKEKKKEQKKRFTDFHDSVLLAIANFDNIKARKIGDGIFGKTGLELVDGVYELNERRIAICVQSVHGDWLKNSRSSILSGIRGLAVEISKGVFDEAFVAFDRDVDDETEFQELLDDLRSIAKEDLVSKINIISGCADHVISQISQQLSSGRTA